MPLLALLGLLVTAQPQTATVAGRVTDQSTGRPVPRMMVSVVGTDRQTAAEALTDADGRYEIAGLRPGRYAMAVMHDEHRSTYLRQWVGEALSANAYVPPRFGLELKAGERRTGVDIALTRALAIEGVVLDPSGDPVTQVEVDVLRAAGGSANSAATYTDDRGAYRLYGLAPGRYHVCVRPSNDRVAGDSTELVRTCHPAAVTEADAADITLTSLDASGIDIRLQLIAGRSVTGTIVDANGVPADGATVSVMPLDDSTAHGGDARVQNGAFTVKGLAPGRYLVGASLGGSPPGDPNPPARERESAYAPVDLAAVDGNVALTLSRTATIAGNVLFEGGTAPRSVRGVTVGTLPPADLRSWHQSRPPAATVREDGSFQLEGLERLPLHVMLRGLPDGWALKAVRLGEREITYAATDFTAATPARLQLVVTNKVASPSVKVVNDRGEDVPASHGMAFPADPNRWTVTSVRIPERPATGAASSLGSMLPGDYIFTALSIDDFLTLMRNPSRLGSLAAIGTKVTLEAGDTRVFTLRIVPLPDR
jgi:protocatechuate 3,4-dioxygenase beta subunit